MSRIQNVLAFALCSVVLLSDSLCLRRVRLSLKSSLVLRGGFKNMFGEEQCRNFSRGEAGVSKRIAVAKRNL